MFEVIEVPAEAFPKLMESYLSGSYRVYLIVEEMPEKKIFSCKECGKPFEAYPPDDIYTKASLTKTDDCVERTYECSNEKPHKNTVYWAKASPKVFMKTD